MGKELFKDQDYNLFWLMRYAWITWDKARTRELIKYNCTPAQAGILLIIQAIEPQNVTQAELSRWMLREPHAISTIIDRMEKAGLVERVNESL